MKEDDIPGPRAWRFQLLRPDGSVEHHSGIGVFDELMVAGLLHVEWTAGNVWSMQVGDAQITLEPTADGKVRVDVVRGANGDILGQTSRWHETGQETGSD